MPAARAIASAVRRSSPVSMTTFQAQPAELGDRGGGLGLSVSAIPRILPAGRRWPRRPRFCRRRRVARRPRQGLLLRHSDRRTPPARPRPDDGRPWPRPAPGHGPEYTCLGEAQAAESRPPRGRSPRRADAPSRAQRRSGRGSGSGGAPSAITMSVTRGCPSVSVPVLSSTTVRTLPSRSRASASRNRIPASAALPVPTMIEVGVANPSARGQAMMSTATVLRREVERRRRPEGEPGGKRQRREDEHGRDEVARHDVGEALDQGQGLGLGDHPDDPREHRLRPDSCRPEGEGAAAVQGAADHEGIDPLRDRQALAGRACSHRPTRRPRRRRHPPRSSRRAGPGRYRRGGRRRPAGRRRLCRGRPSPFAAQGATAGGSRRTCGPSPAPRGTGRAG